MKLIKNIVFVLFLSIMILLPNKVNATMPSDDIYNDMYTNFEIKFTVEEPKLGDTPVTSAKVESGTYEGNIDISWYESEDSQNWAPMSTATFENGKFYSPYISLTMEEIDFLLSFQDTSKGGSIFYYLNGEFFYLKTHDVNFPIGIYQVIDNTMLLELNGDSFVSTKKDFETTLKGIENFTRIPDEIEIIIENETLIEETHYTYNRETGKIIVFAENLVGDLEIKAEGIEQFLINIEYVNENTIINTDNINVDIGGSVDVYISPTIGYNIISIKVNNTEIELEENCLKFDNIKENIDIVVELEKNQNNNNLVDDGTIGEVESDNLDIETNKNSSNNPPTGDNIKLYIIVAIISLVGICITTKFSRNIKDDKK